MAYRLSTSARRTAFPNRQNLKNPFDKENTHDTPNEDTVRVEEYGEAFLSVRLRGRLLPGAPFIAFVASEGINDVPRAARTRQRTSAGPKLEPRLYKIRMYPKGG